MPWNEIGPGVPLKKIADIAKAQLLLPENHSQETLIAGLCPLTSPKPQHLSLTRERSWRKIAALCAATELGALLIRAGLRGDMPPLPIPILLVSDPILALIDILPLFFSPRRLAPGISPRAEISASARIAEGVHIGAFCVVGDDVEVGTGSVIHPHVVLYPGVRIGRGAVLHSGVIVREDCQIGDGVVLQPGAVIGADGFGYAPHPEKGIVPVPQVGDVRLAAGVEVGANSCIDRATLGSTSVGPLTKIDNLAQVGHNVQIGMATIICGQVGIAGSCQIGNEVTLGGASGLRDHVKICDRVRVAGKSGVTSDIEAPGDYAGFPAVEAASFRRQVQALQLLPKVLRSMGSRTVFTKDMFTKDMSTKDKTDDE